MWAVFVAEGLDIFWALRKGEGCLGGMEPVTAAIEGIGWERPVSMVEKVGDRAIEGRRGGVNERGTNGGSVTYREEGRGEGMGHEAQNLSRGSRFLFSGVTGGRPPGQTRFDGPRFIHSARLEASNRNRHRIITLPLFGGGET
jgi:hypothetical protein